MLFPPHLCPPGVHPSSDGLDLATPVSISIRSQHILDFVSPSGPMEIALIIIIQFEWKECDNLTNHLLTIGR